MTQDYFFIVRPSDRKLANSLFPGTVRNMICDSATPTNNLVTGTIKIVEPGGRIPLHYHSVEEFQFVLSGEGVARDGRGDEHAVSAGTAVYCRPGLEGAHEFENKSKEPLEILFVFPSEGGKFPHVEVIDPR